MKLKKGQIIAVVSVAVLFIGVLALSVVLSVMFVREPDSFVAGWGTDPVLQRLENAQMIATRPSEKQLKHAEMEMYAFFHYGVNTYNGVEWGDGTESPDDFAPTDVIDTDQWVDSVKLAGMKGVIIIAKHHDGFCLWPSEYTEHSTKNSKKYRQLLIDSGRKDLLFKNGKQDDNGYPDIVAQLSKSCKDKDVKFGVYLSPWDRNNEDYGINFDKYSEYYMNQLRELCSNYGEIFELWFDGAVGEELEGVDKEKMYNWTGFKAVIDELQPNAVTAISFPDADVRWIGNETGLAGDNVWSVRKNNSGEFLWGEGECDVSIRNGWFYHEEENPKSIEQLMYIYMNSVGRNSSLLLNIPPDKAGKIDEKDVARLKEFGEEINKLFGEKKAFTFRVGGRHITESAYKDFDGNSFMLESNEFLIDVKLAEKQRVKYLVLGEDIGVSGQRIEGVEIYVLSNGRYIKMSEQSFVGKKTIIDLDGFFAPMTDGLRIVVTKARGNPWISKIELY